MRTLKKTLCLVLVLAMMVGLCAVGASAITVNDYKDKDQIQNMEAFATLTAIGVFQGDDTGNVHPNDALKRAEGATLAAKMHATSGSGVSSFTDMGTYAWAQPAVAFCESNGIINGYGDGTFGPGDPLSTVAFAKICLCALGFDAEKEGLVGSQWEINTIKLVNALDLAAGIPNPDWNSPIPRWQAGQFCYNTLQATMVDYNNGLNFTVTTSDGTKVEVGTGASAVVNNSYDYRNILHEKTDDTMEFCEQYFPNLKMKTKVEDGTFGFTNNVWYMGDNRKDQNLTSAKTIAKVQASTTMAVYDTNMFISEKQLYADGNLNKDFPSLTVIENGYTITKDYEPVRTNGAGYPFSGITGSPKIAGEVKNYKGATIFLIDTDNEGDEGYGIADTLIVKYPYLATVTKVIAATNTADRKVALKIYNNAAGTAYDLTTDKFNKNDWLVVYPLGAMGTAITSKTVLGEATLAESTQGTLSKVTVTGPGASALTIGGVSYSVGANAFVGPKKGEPVATTADNYVLGTGMTAYISNGFVLGVVSDAVAYGDYVFAIKASGTTNTLDSTTYLVGSVDQSAVATEVTGYGIKNATEAAKLSNTWATKTEAGTNSYSFSASPLSKAFPIKELKPDQATLNNGGAYTVVADNNTVFIIRTGTGFKAYTGISAVPTYKNIKAGEAYALLPDYDGAHAAAVYIDARDDTAENTTTAMIYMISEKYTDKEIDGKTTLYNWKAIVDGKVTVLQTKKADFTGNGKLGLVVPGYDGQYLASIDKSTVKNVIMDRVDVASGDAYAVVVDAGTLTVNGTAYVLAADAVAYVYDSKNPGNPLASGTPAEVLDGESGGKISLVKAASSAKITTIYFEK